MGSIVTKLIQNYKDGQEDRLQEGWDYVQAQVRCLACVCLCVWVWSSVGLYVPEGDTVLVSWCVSVYLTGTGCS